MKSGVLGRAGGAKQFDLKYFNIDPAYVREIYCYDLFRRYGVNVSLRTNYCRLTVYVEGDSKPAYYGVYMLMEHINKDFLKDRIDDFGDAKGNLWKCKAATLGDSSDDLFFVDDNSTRQHNYELKTNKKNFDDAKEEIKSFIRDFQEKQGDEFHAWIQSRCDVELLLKTYAVNVAVGNWDDYWNNKQNYYVYFNSDSKFFFIPFDIDNSLGICANIGKAINTPYADPFDWGIDECNLISKLLQYDDFRQLYKEALLDLVSTQNSYLSYEASVTRILSWQQMVKPYVANDTNENTEVVDYTLGTHNEYKLTADSDYNYFRIRCYEIENYCDEGIVDGIPSVEMYEMGSTNYSLSGHIITTPQKGIYINKNKKIIIK